MISNHSDFLFVYEATNCNPNGDPDQENKPRMDYDTNTNLVTDVRLKRYIRDYLKQSGNQVFVDMEGLNKVSPDSKLEAVLDRLLVDAEYLDRIFEGADDMRLVFEKMAKAKTDKISFVKLLQAKGGDKNLNYFLLSRIVQEVFIDIRLFGSAFAVKEFTRSFTGPVQINWGFSLHPVELMDSNSIVTIMNDDNSTFGKDYRLYYSLIAFSGSINKFPAETTGLTDGDLEVFRKAIWESIPSQPTRSKLNQYPKLYIEVVYNEGFGNGYFGDLRNYLEVEAKDGDFKKVRRFSDLVVKTDKLVEFLTNNKGEGKAVKEIIVRTTHDLPINL